MMSKRGQFGPLGDSRNRVAFFSSWFPDATNLSSIWRAANGTGSLTRIQFPQARGIGYALCHDAGIWNHIAAENAVGQSRAPRPGHHPGQFDCGQR